MYGCVRVFVYEISIAQFCFSLTRRCQRRRRRCRLRLRWVGAVRRHRSSRLRGRFIRRRVVMTTYIHMCVYNMYERVCAYVFTYSTQSTHTHVCTCI